MEIFIADKYVQFIIGDSGGNIEMAFLRPHPNPRPTGSSGRASPKERELEDGYEVEFREYSYGDVKYEINKKNKSY